MKIITVNVNGIRSANNKGFFTWLKIVDADIICLQEIKANIEDIPDELKNIRSYNCHFHPAQKKGYSGVAIYTKLKPHNIIVGLNKEEIDNEGRYLEFDYTDFSVVSIYLPSGSSGSDKQEKKFRFMEYYLPILKEKLASGKNYIICGDWNIAHNEIDLKNWKGNIKNSGFLHEERAWLTSVLDLGYTDTWRHLYKDIPGYTWWSNRGQAYAKDVGWRIDYQLVSTNLKDKLVSSYIYKEQKFSDHAPLMVEYSLTLR